jgi:uncharacterized protein with ATP-grasp and redox domains
MNNEEKKIKIEEALKDQNLFLVKSVMDVNHKPHIFCITEKHVVYASDNCGGMLSDSAIKEYEKKHGPSCGMYVKGNNIANHRISGYEKCTIPYSQHTSDNICFLQLLRNGTKEEGQTILKDLVDSIGEKFIDGFSLVETKEEFRIK